MAYIRKPSIPKPINQTKGEKKICVSNVDSNSVDVREIKRNYVIQQRGKIKMSIQAVENNRWLPKDESNDLTEVAVAVIKTAILDDLKDGIQIEAYQYDERLIDPLWWNIISKSSKLDIRDLKTLIIQESMVA